MQTTSKLRFLHAGESSEQYAFWELNIPAYPARSRLYDLRPIGAGTPYVESLTSYITRLAFAHCVSVRSLVFEEILPRFPRGYWTDGSVQSRTSLFHQCGHQFNGMGSMADGAIHALEDLTGRGPLLDLTVRSWHGHLSNRGVLQHERAWCPACYREWCRRKEPLYEPLLWSVQAVRVCPRHGERLQSRCPYMDCGRTNPALGSRACPGHCSHCHRWLGIDPVEANGKDIIVADGPWEFWTANVIGDVLAAAPDLSMQIRHRRISDSLLNYVNSRCDSSMRGADESIGTAPGTFRRWLRQDASPTLDLLLRCCNRLNTSPMELLGLNVPVEGEDPQTPPLQTPLRSTPAKRERFDELRYRKLLLDVLANDETVPPSMAAVARSLGYQRSNLHARFPDLCRAISARYLLHKRELAARKKAERCEMVRAITNQIHSEGEYPSAHKVCGRLDQRNYWRLPGIGEAWRQALAELALADPSPSESAAGTQMPDPEA